MDMTILEGLPLSRAQELLRENGLTPRITLTSDPRHQRDAGTLRVLRASEDELVAARFLDATPEK